MRAIQRFGRRASLVLLSTFFAAPVFGDSTGQLLSVSRLFQTKGSYTGPAATKIAEFKEDFVAGGMDFSADGVNLATDAMVDGQDVHIRDWRNGGRLVRVLHKGAPSGGGMAIRYSPDGTILAVGNEADKVGNRFRLVRVWDTRSWEVIQDLGDAQAASGLFMGLAFTPDGKFLVRTIDRGGNHGEQIIVHRTDTWDEVWGFINLPLIPRTLVISPDGSLAAVMCSGLEGSLGQIKENSKIVIVDLAKRNVRRTIENSFAGGWHAETLAWSPDGRSLVAGAVVGERPGQSQDAIRIFDVATGTQVAYEQASDSAHVSGLAFSPDGRFLVEGYLDGNVRIWDSEHKKLLQQIPIPDLFQPAVAISRDSRYLAIGDGKVVSIWEFTPTSSVH